MTEKTSFEDFARRVQEAHGNTLLIKARDYSLIGKPTKVTCLIHRIEIELKSAWSLTKSNPCKLCVRDRKLKEYFDRFNRKIHERYPDLVLVKEPESYNGSAILRCPTHGDFEAKADAVIFGRTGCRKCSISKSSLSRTGLSRTSFTSFQRRFLERYGGALTLVRGESEFTNMNSKMTVKCPDATHKEFTKTARDLLRFQGCRNCSESAGERLVRTTLEALGLEFEQEKRFPTCRDKKDLPFDFWLPHHATLIEFQGRQHEVEADRFGGATALASLKKRDSIKKSWANENGLRLIYVSDYKNVKGEILKDLPVADDFCPEEIVDRLNRKNLEWTSEKWKKYLSRLNQVHQHRYDFSASKWSWGDRDINYFCPLHGKITGNLFNLLKGHGCSLCAGNQVAFSELVERSKMKFGEGFELFSETFRGMNEEMDMACPVHGKMRIIPNTHLRLSKGCRRCGGKAEDGSPEKFLIKAMDLFAERFDYSNIGYTGASKR